MIFQRRSSAIICGLVSIFCFNFTNGENLTKTLTNADTRISDLQNVLRTVQGDILDLNIDLALDVSYTDIKARLSAVKAKFKKLDSAIILLNNYYHSLDTEFKDLRAPIDIADEIRSHNFEKAENLLLDLADNDKIAKIVHYVYANNHGNTDTLLDFAKSLIKIDHRLYVLSALSYEMRENDHHDPYKMMALVSSMEKGVVNQKKATAEEKALGQEVINAAVADITAVATESLKTAMYKENYQLNDENNALLDKISQFRSSLYIDVMQRTINEVYPTVSAVTIANNILTHKFVSQIVSGLLALFRRLESADDLNNKAIISICEYLRRLHNKPNAVYIPKSQMEEFNRFLEKMPSCTENV